MIHPELLARYLHTRRVHRSIGVPGELTARRELESLDPHGVLSAAIEIGEERAAGMLRDHHHEPGDPEC